MPLPQQVINQLSREPEKTPGWSAGILLFSSVLLIIVFVIYFFMTLIYAPQLNASLAAVQGKVATLDQSIASGDEAALVAFYSQVVNLRTVLGNHIVFSQFFEWLQRSTESNVSFTQMSFSSGSQVTLTGTARTEADINEQVAIFESSPNVAKFTISNITQTAGTSQWAFSATLIMNSSLYIASSSTQ